MINISSIKFREIPSNRYRDICIAENMKHYSVFYAHTLNQCNVLKYVFFAIHFLQLNRVYSIGAEISEFQKVTKAAL